jgi:large subunit ribosomal protein L4
VATLKKYDFTGKEVDQIEVKDDLLEIKDSHQMIKNYLVAIRNNARQWSANTKRRREVRASGKKPHPQKGLGRARQGCVAAPQFKGGGVAFGPKPKFNMHVRINKKERRQVIRALLADKIKSNNVKLLKSDSLDVSKTKQVSSFIKNIDIEKKRILFLDINGEKSLGLSFVKCMRNIPKTDYTVLANVNGYDLAVCQEIIVMETAYEELMAIIGKIGG